MVVAYVSLESGTLGGVIDIGMSAGWFVVTWMSIPFARGALPFPCSLPDFQHLLVYLERARWGEGLSAACTGTMGAWCSAAIPPRGCFIAVLVVARQASLLAPLWDAPTYHTLGLVLSYPSGHQTCPRCIGCSVSAATWAVALRGPPSRGS